MKRKDLLGLDGVSREEITSILDTALMMRQVVRSNNKKNVVKATIAGLANLKEAEEVAKLRGKDVDQIVG